MSCLIPSACVFCRHYHADLNEQRDSLPSCNAFVSIPEEIFLGRFDHAHAYPGDGGIRFVLIETERQDFLELNAVRRQLGMLTYGEPPEGPTDRRW
jgi:hypothetical protein